MGNSSPSYKFRGTSFLVAFLLFISLSVPLISAQENGSDESSTSIKDLGRRGKIGDETFIIAALMAMRHPKSIVLSGALSALFVMTILSTGLGRIVPNLISRKHTNSAATVLYTFFGLRLLYIAWKSDPKGSQKKEIEEVEEKLEAGQGKTTWRRFFSRFCTPIYLESFILTFLAEWGDRSQIATIALATHKNAVGVAAGATIGHTICTSVAVIGGSMLASKISQRTVATVGGLLFLGFSLSSYFYPPL
ncbi:GDT1-like protein 3 isoform X3 [Salvia hispanica]|uniref:GDT1-like protein 3 isoform X3 n=1 Tax=Salvia hispanica TaxID=49212 RepID=UPI0020099145|nr:GDT1-like protein 3 isoform X3 [Salvia hispanica]